MADEQKSFLADGGAPDGVLVQVIVGLKVVTTRIVVVFL
jgi:hypothetical protein